MFIISSRGIYYCSCVIYFESSRKLEDDYQIQQRENGGRVCDTKLLGNERGKNVPEKLELSVLNFYPLLTMMTLLGSFSRISEGENLDRNLKPTTTSTSDNHSIHQDPNIIGL